MKTELSIRIDHTPLLDINCGCMRDQWIPGSLSPPTHLIESLGTRLFTACQ